MSTLLVELDGARPEPEALADVATRGYGHTTYLQVRGGAARGLALHRARLTTAHRELFGSTLDVDRVQALVASAVREHPDSSVRVAVTADDDGTARVLVTVRPPAEVPGPQRLASMSLQRQVPHLKHLGTFAQGWAYQQARGRGFDDALLLDDDGHLLEATMWNVALMKDGVLVLPAGALLPGITMRLLQLHLPNAGVKVEERPVPLSEVAEAEAVLLTNSYGVAAVSAVDDVAPPMSETMAAFVDELYRAVPEDRLG